MEQYRFPTVMRGSSYRSEASPNYTSSQAMDGPARKHSNSETTELVKKPRASYPLTQGKCWGKGLFTHSLSGLGARILQDDLNASCR